MKAFYDEACHTKINAEGKVGCLQELDMALVPTLATTQQLA